MNCSKQQLQDVDCLENTDEENCKCVLVRTLAHYPYYVIMTQSLLSILLLSQEIYLCFNYVTEIPAKALAAYSHLTHLSLACNNLTSLPPALGACCPKLQYLCVANNRVSIIENLDGLSALESLDLRCNRISCLENILTLTNLKK